ncbi:hypothetical protein SAMN05660653_00538 [Desulfonatronum thiosulfatophilum]|uniref:NAD(+)--protein-arginine ADP-ribosyltransferase n=1 Tax=Desulfonatronum thiosulfatophilum TaxID=617002 RepID=A0A1G6ASY9_9BACT|nr:hypothetical protein SAMN05660653_00538 [Desulfonatronum thiosulfatophilum]
MRERLSKSPVGELLTLTDDIGIYDCENFFLEGAIKRYPFSHWLDHLAPLHVKLLDDYRDRSYKSGDDFEPLKDALVTNLRNGGFEDQANELADALDEKVLNGLIVRQYTEETGLYPAINQLLRKGHSGEDVSGSPLTPWICQLAVALRNFPEFVGTSYRGTEMSEANADKYFPGEIFIWAPFTSASKKIDSCFGGNVIFEIVPVSALSERDKRAPRDIAGLSVYPSEEEVLLPMCCAYRPTSVERRGDVRHIRVEILDHN